MKKGSFIVSCQALDNEPLHSSFIMGKMALSAFVGGADGIRANTVDDIKEIKKNVNLPIIGIIKKDYNDSSVYITPTIKEVEQLYKEGVDVIAIDATNRIRPGQINLKEFYVMIKKLFPEQKLMADCSTFEEMKYASQLGFEFVGTTLFGYTEYSRTSAFEDMDLFIEQISGIKANIIGEGQINTPIMAKQIMPHVHSIVVGGAITRPQNITKLFRQELDR